MRQPDDDRDLAVGVTDCPLAVLVLGGTGFLGRSLVAALLGRGHRVTTFERGRRPVPEGQAAVERLRGDRGGDLTALAGRRWDVAIDLCGLGAAQLSQTVAVLAQTVERYVYISGVAAYENLNVPGITESDTLRSRLTTGDRDDGQGGNFGVLKAESEGILRAAWGDRLTVVRPNLLVGPGDPSDRFSYWVRRLAAGGDVIAPAPPQQPVQYLDVRDLARWLVETVELGRSGEFNAATPDLQWTLETVLATVATAVAATGGGDACIHWVAEEFLLEAAVEPWTELPLWLPLRDRLRGFARMDCRKIARSGLVCRPLAETVRDILDWDEQFGTPERPKAGLPRDREATLLEQWRRDWLPHQPTPAALQPMNFPNPNSLDAFDALL